MNSNKSLRILVGGILLLLAAGALHWWSSESDAPSESATVATAEQESPVNAARRQPGVRFQAPTRSPSARVASSRTPNVPSTPLGQRLSVEWKGTWYPAEILTSSGGSHYIRYTGYGSEWDEWVTQDRMRYSDAESAPPENPTTPQAATPELAIRMSPEPGDPVVLWGNQWWRAEVLKTESDKSLIRYIGYGAEWDEWVGADRFKVYSEEDARNKATTTTLTTELRVLETMTESEPNHDFAPLVQGRPAQGDLLVEWGKKWWPAEIVKQEGASYFIHYKNYGTNWDEWVTLQRIGHYTGTE